MNPIRYLHDMKIKELHDNLAAYDADQDVEFRKKINVCRFCHYMFPGRNIESIRAGKCQLCGEQLVFIQGLPEKYCKRCAAKQHICSRCGDDMD